MPDRPDLPWFPFDVDAFLTSRWVQRMLLTRPELVGYYVVLLAHQWKDGALPDDIDEIAALCLTDAERMRDAWPELAKRFHKGPAGWVNERMAKTRAEQEEKADQRKESARKAAEARWEKHADRIAGRIPKAMQE